MGRPVKLRQSLNDPFLLHSFHPGRCGHVGVNLHAGKINPAGGKGVIVSPANQPVEGINLLFTDMPGKPSPVNGTVDATQPASGQMGDKHVVPKFCHVHIFGQI